MSEGRTSILQGEAVSRQLSAGSSSAFSQAKKKRSRSCAQCEICFPLENTQDFFLLFLRRTFSVGIGRSCLRLCAAGRSRRLGTGIAAGAGRCSIVHLRRRFFGRTARICGRSRLQIVVKL